jgi:hypothetical protein
VPFPARLRARPTGRNINGCARASRSAQPLVYRLYCATLGDGDSILKMAKLSTIWGDFVTVAINLNEINPGK